MVFFNLKKIKISKSEVQIPIYMIPGKFLPVQIKKINNITSQMDRIFPNRKKLPVWVVVQTVQLQLPRRKLPIRSDADSLM